MFAPTERPVLNDEQVAAVDHDAGHLLIVAGAGTGKTTTLAARLARLVATGVAPERIMLLTFSRRAATELVRRAEVWTDGVTLTRVHAGTFHAVANRMLRRYGAAIGVAADATLLDPADTAELMALVRDRMLDDDPNNAGGPRRRRARKEVLAQVLSRVVNTRTPLAEVVARHYPWCGDQVDELRAVARAYVEHKRAHHLLDYDDLLVLWHALLADEVAGPHLAARFDHVLVDEFQDTNAVQADVLRCLAAHGATVTAVGDDAQAIYGFRGATVRNILDFPTEFGADALTLTRNHRSTEPVVAAANAIWRAATERHDKELVSVRGPGTLPRLVTAPDEHGEARGVCDRVLDAMESGRALRDQAVLFRTAHHTDVLELELTVRGIPYVKFGGLAFLEAAHVKDLLALCRAAINPRDDLAWFRVLPRVAGIGAGRARRLIDDGATERRAVAEAAIAAGMPGDTHERLQALDAAIAAAASAASDDPGAAVTALRDWLDPLLDRFGNALERRADLDRLAEVAARSESLEQFLSDLTLDPPASTGELAGEPHLDDDYLTLSTIHSAKGGEWPVVHLIHAADGCLPSDLSTGDTEAIEEERRLLYVAATRAADELTVHVPLRFHHHRGRLDDAATMAQRSRFLDGAVVSHFSEEVLTVAGPVDPTTGELCTRRGRPAVHAADAALDALIG